MVFKKTIWLVALFAVALTLNSCKTSCPGDGPRERITPMTLIFYMGGDNNLSGETFQKIRAIADANLRELSNSKISNIFIYQDHNHGDKRPTLWRVKHVAGYVPSDVPLELTEMATLEFIEDYEPQNSAAPETLAAAISRCVEEGGRATNYGLWVFSHGSGWLPTGNYSSPRSARTIVQDGGNYMELAEFASAIPDYMFDFILFESCLSAGIEVVYELRNKANCLFVSSAEMVSPGLLELYDYALYELFKDEWTYPYEAMTRAANIYFDHCNAQNGNKSATVSVIKTDALEGLAKVAKEILQNGVAVDDISEIQEFNYSSSATAFFDFMQYFSLMATPKQQARLEEALNNVVIYKAATEYFSQARNGFKIDHHSGLTSYIPQSKYPFLNGEHKKLEWAKAIGADQ